MVGKGARVANSKVSEAWPGSSDTKSLATWEWGQVERSVMYQAKEPELTEI